MSAEHSVVASVVVLDIEGTTTDLSFVHEVLFPYATEHLPTFLKENLSDTLVRELVENAARALEVPFEGEGSLDEVLQGLYRWISEDRKIGVLKALQGLIWKQGYLTGELKAHIYEDVCGAVQSWKEQGFRVGIYSSGSVEAQKLLFAHTDYGDLNEYLDFYFDTNVGQKKQSSSYSKIADELCVVARDILFLSDNAQELQAARDVDWQVLHVIRDERTPKANFPVIGSFAQLNLQSPS